MRLRPKDISAREMGDEVIVLDLQSSRYLSITGVGIRLFELLSQERSIEELVDTIASEYEVSPDVARRDTERFIEQLQASGLLMA